MVMVEVGGVRFDRPAISFFPPYLFLPYLFPPFIMGAILFLGGSFRGEHPQNGHRPDHAPTPRGGFHTVRVVLPRASTCAQFSPRGRVSQMVIWL